MKAFDSFRLDAANHFLWRGDERVAITPRAFDVLRHLVENAGRLVSPDELLEALWPETYVNPEVLRKYILEIRKALGDRPDNPSFIETVTKRGYRFVAAVTEVNGVAPPDMPGTDATNVTQELLTSGTAPAQEISSLTNAKPGKNLLRELAIPAAVLAVTVVAIAGYFWRGRNRLNVPSSSDTSIAVLPFADLSPGKDQEYFSDGLTEQLINDLAQVPGLKVVARSSAFQFKGKVEDPHSVGQKLGVAHILEGSVRKEGNRVRITAELTKTSDGFQLWSETYDREVSHIFAAQDDIAAAVTGALQLKLLSANGAAIPDGSRTSNPEAYQAYLQGQYFIARGQDQEDLEKALSYADQAIKLDANYAPAWVQRSQVMGTLARVALVESNEGFGRARESAEKAIALDPKLAGAYLALAQVQTNHDWDWEGADRSLQRAASLEPGSAAVLGLRAHLASNLGNLEEAIGFYKQAIALDPLRANYQLALAYNLYLVRRWEEAQRALQMAEQLNPQISSLHLTRGKVLLFEGRKEEALAEMEKESGDWQRLSGESLAYYALGRRDEADRALQKLIATHQNDCAYQVGEAYAFRGETDKAFAWLERSVEQRDPGAPDVRANPFMNSLRQDPRYVALLKKIHLPV